MKQLVCEMCGSTDIVKQDGLFVCQTCGCKYSVEEAKKMMIDGVVEVTGTVKVDNSDRIEKILINAKRAFDDRKFSEAQNLYGQILNEDPENATAIMYQGLSLGWQGNTVRYYMDKTGAAVERAVDIAHKQMSDGEEFAGFAKEALVNILNLGQALNNLCMQNIHRAIQNSRSAIERHGKRTSLYSSYSEWLQESNNIQNRMNTEVDKQFAIMDTTYMIVLSSYEKVIKNTSKVEYYKETFYKEIDTSLKQLISLKDSLRSTRFVTKAQLLSVTVNSYLKKKEDIKAAEKKRKIEEYWQEHKEEKKALDTERTQLAEEERELEKQEKEYTGQEDSLKRELAKMVPAAEEKEEITNKIKQLTLERSKLGLFKGKEKKAIDSQISDLQNKLGNLEPLIKQQEAEQKKEYDMKMLEVLALKKPVSDRLSSIDSRMSQIDWELTRDR